MSSMPLQTVLQQQDARPVSGEHLEMLGKKAAAEWCCGDYGTLSSAVVGTVRQEQLSPEQVKRVVEFCNQDAYITEFNKEGSSHKVVNFHGGPADPSEVLQDLNDGGGGTVYDDGTLDYQMPPEHMSKAASAEAMEKTAEGMAVAGLPKLKKLPELPKVGSLDHYEPQLLELLGGGKETKLAYADPLKDLSDVRNDLEGALGLVTSNMDSMEIDFMDVSDRLYFTVKQAALEGTPLGDVVAAWSTVSTDANMIKAAFKLIAPKLHDDGVFLTKEAFDKSLHKTASVGEVNKEHQVVASYAQFCDVLSKLANLRQVKNELEEGLNQATALLKKASYGGLVGKGVQSAKTVGKAIDKAAPRVAEALVGAEKAKGIAPALALGTKGTAALGAGLVANTGLQSVTDRPSVRKATGGVKSIVPGTAEYQLRRYRTMTGR